MTSYKQTIEFSTEELSLLNRFCEKRERPFAFADLKALQDALEQTPDARACIIQHVNEKAGIDVLDVWIAAEFEDGMIAEICYWGMVGETRGVYSGIQFGDKDRIYKESSEWDEDCYEVEPEDAEPNHRRCVEGVYRVFYKGSIYEVEVKAA